MTVADIRVQKTIESNLKHLYPTLRIMGEESKESTETVDSAVNPDQITDAIKAFVGQSFLNQHHQDRLEMIRD